MNYNRHDSSTSHNQYCVKNTTAHYIQCQPEQEETLLDRVLGYSAFALFMLLMAFL